jgi:hypothetical protein
MDRNLRQSWPRHAVRAGVVVLVAGACYLMAVRGPALILDLSAASRYLFCF